MRASGLLAGTVIALMVASSLPAGAEGATGALVFDPPLVLQDAFLATGAGAVRVAGAVGGADAGFAAAAAKAHVRLVVREVESADAGVLVRIPGPGVRETQTTRTAAAVRVTALGPDADVLLASVGGTPLAAMGAGPAPVGVTTEDLRAVDGYCREYEDGEGCTGDLPGRYSFSLPAPLLSLAPERVEFAGTAEVYAYDAEVEVCDASGCDTYATGHSQRPGALPGTSVERWEFVVIALEEATGALAPTGAARIQHHAPLLSIDTTGTIHLPDARGVVETQDGTYAARGEEAMVASGALRLELRPTMEESPLGIGAPTAALSADLAGDLVAINVPPLPGSSQPAITPAVAGAAAAGSVGLVAGGLYAVAKWKGVAVFALLRTRARSEPELSGEDLEDEPLLHPDCHRIYYLLQRRGVLSAAEAEALLGVARARHHLEALSKQGLVGRRTDGRGLRRRTHYVFPGSEFEERVDRLLLLAEPDAGRVGALLDASGEVELVTLIAAAARGAPPLRASRARAVLDTLVTAGLARAETVAGVLHVSPTPELRRCLLLRSGLTPDLRLAA